MKTARVVMSLFVGMLFFGVLLPTGSATNDPPVGGGNVTGDWNVIDSRTYTGVNINVAGNIIIASTGTLTLNGVTLNINGASAGQYAITVNSGGKLYTTAATTINTSTTYNYRFVVNSGGIVDMKDTTVSKCGVLGGGIGRGIYINSNTVLMSNVTVQNGYEGIHIEYASPTIVNSTIKNHQYYGIYATNGQPIVNNCTISNNGVYGGANAVLWEYTNSSGWGGRISNCTMDKNYYGPYFNLDSPVLFENNSVTGSTLRGIWIRMSNAIVRNNNISGNKEYGVFMEDCSPWIDRNNITGNGDASLARAGLNIYFQSNPLVENNLFDNNIDTGLIVRPTCSPQIRNNIFSNHQNGPGIKLDYCDNARIINNNFSSNFNGILSQSSTPTITGNAFWANANDALHAETTTTVFEGNTVMGCGMRGIHAMLQSKLLVGNSTFTSGNQWGVYTETNSTALVVNCNFTDEYKEALLSDQWSTIDWLVNSNAIIDGHNAVLRGNLTITPTGKLTLNSVHMDINSDANFRRFVDVQSGAELTIDGCNITAYNPAIPYKFTSAGKLKVNNTVLEKAGWAPGTDGETAGFYLNGGQLTMTSSAVQACYSGLILRGVTAQLESSSIDDNSVFAADMKSSVLEMRNGTLGGASQYLIQLDSNSRAEMINSVFDQNKVNLVDGPSIINVWWYFTVKVQWVNGDPAPGANVNLTDSKGARTFSKVTDLTGNTTTELVQEYTQKSASKTSYTPHIINVTKSTMTSENPVNINQSMYLRFTFIDSTLPELDVLAPANGGSQTNKTVNIYGTARDIESGIQKVEVCWNNATWNLANTTNDWTNWNITVDLYSSTYTIKTRATNYAGLVRYQNITFSIDDQVPFLIVDAPKDNYATNQSSLTVTGKTEKGANVTVNTSGYEYVLVNTNGVFTGLVDLVEGSNSLVITTTDMAGNTNSTTRTVVLDTIPPWIKLELPRVSFTSLQSVMVNGTTDGVYVTVNGQLASLNGTNFTKTVILNTGAGVTNTTIDVVARDAVGNSNKTTVYVMKDSSPPSVILQGPPDNMLTNGSTIYVNGTTEPGATITVNGVKVPVDAGGNFSQPIELSEGMNTLTIVTTDPAGNSRRYIRVVTRDSTPPPLTVTAPVDNSHTYDNEISVTGTSEANARITVNGEEVLTGTAGEFTRGRFPLILGQNTIVVVAVDGAGNIATVTVKVIRDEVPVPPIIPPNNNGTKNNLDLMLPMILLLVIVIGGVGGAAYVFKSGSGNARTPPPGAAGARRRPPQQQQQQRGPTKMRSPTEEAIARKEGDRSSDRPRSADDLYGKDYASKKSGYQEPKYDYSQPPASKQAASQEPDYTNQWTQKQAAWDSGQTTSNTQPQPDADPGVWQPGAAEAPKVWQPPAAPAEEEIPEAPTAVAEPAPPASRPTPAKPPARAPQPAKPPATKPAEPEVPPEPEAKPDESHAKLDSDIESLLAKIGETSKKK
jgi:parallel beta-helix repeat protein